MTIKDIRVRFAPSPTGNLHIGTLRTALFAYLFTRQKKGTYILRIEDTDTKRSTKVFEETIFEGLSWFGINWDEGPGDNTNFGPYRQSERIKKGIYAPYVDKLIGSGHAYYCFDTALELEKEREESKRNGVAYKYSRKALQLSDKEIDTELKNKVPYTIRFKIPATDNVTYTDLIRGNISFDYGLISDFVIQKSDGIPTYNFAAVIDDILMKISHVIRGEDHISNMPKQLAIWKALSIPAPQFAHLPMILGADKSKLSKRHGATSITEYRQLGYLSYALFNFISFLGWSPGNEEEFFSKESLINQFDLNRVGKSNAIFDTQKLNWMNGHYIRQLENDQFAEKVSPFLSKENKALLSSFEEEKKALVLTIIKEQLQLLSECNSVFAIFSKTTDVILAITTEHHFSETDHMVLKEVKEQVVKQSPFKRESGKLILEEVEKKTGLKKGQLFKPLRFAISAEKSGPNLADLLFIFGESLLLDRLNAIVKK